MNYLWPARPRTSIWPLSHFTSPYSEIWVTFNVPQQMLITLCARVMVQVQIGYPYPQLVWKYENMMSLEPKISSMTGLCVITVNDYVFRMTIMRYMVAKPISMALTFKPKCGYCPPMCPHVLASAMYPWLPGP